METWIITGGAGFIGANFVQYARKNRLAYIINLDALTYAGRRDNLLPVNDDLHHVFVHGDINDAALVNDLFTTYNPHALIHFAAESHVDRSIGDPEVFLTTNILGTYTLLEAALTYWRRRTNAPDDRISKFRFLQVSTDEVYGSLGSHDAPFTETSPVSPNSPYSASKAAADHLVRAFHETYGLPTLTTRCSNNYGPYQYPEKLLPLTLLRALRDEPLVLHGDGQQIRDWLHVEDHCRALHAVLEKGRTGEIYNVGGACERTNEHFLRTLCKILDVKAPRNLPYKHSIQYGADRPGNDRRYAIDSGKLTRDTGWTPQISLSAGLTATVEWYLDHKDWLQSRTEHMPAWRTPLWPEICA